MKNEQKLIAYWRHCLADAERMNIDPKRLQDAFKVTRNEVACGQLSEDLAEAIYEAYLRIERRPARPTNTQVIMVDGQEETEEPGVPILICPMLARPKRYHAQYFAGTEKPLTPLWLPAVVFRDGKLAPPKETLPWMSRNLLDPVFDGRPTVGTVEALDYFLTFNPFPLNEEDKEQPPRWFDLWNYCERMMQAVTGCSMEDFQLEGYETESLAYLLIDSPIQGVSRHVIRLYDTILREHIKGDLKLPQLLRKFTSLDDEEVTPLLTKDEEFKQSQKHYGQMNALHALSHSQREAMHHILRMKASEILAVNGPPGTGKTTLLQSVVATMWVEAARKAAEPPVIVAASTNNQAVRNVIDSFARVEEETSPLAGRWLPQLMSYGLYCPAASRLQEKETDKFQITLPAGGFMSALEAKKDERINLESEEYVSGARSYFMSKCEEYAGQSLGSVNDAIAFLHKELETTISQITHGLQAWRRLNRLEMKIAVLYAGQGGIELYIERCTSDLEEKQNQSEQIKRLREEWLTHVDGFSLWWTLLAFLPPVKQRISISNRRFLSLHSVSVDVDLADTNALTAYFDKAVTEKEHEVKRVTKRLRSAIKIKKRLDRASSCWQQWSEQHGLNLDPPELLEELDRRFRYRAFKLATHYWEGHWLLEMQAQFDEQYKETKAGRKQQKRWRRYAKLTPCFVSTLYMLPDYFLTFDSRDATDELREKPLFDFIDLLIIDEAGQVAPDVAAASFSLAKRSLLVGDMMQLEPVWGITRPIDVGNMRKCGLINSESEEWHIHEKGLSASKGSVMKVAQRASRYQKSDERGMYERGMFLAEHRRCMDEIIQFCNELAYKERLIPMCDRQPHGKLPFMGFSHIGGRSRSAGSSRTNPEEAQAIAEWISDNLQSLKNLYSDKTLNEIIAVVTPFNRQAALLRRELRLRGLEGVTVGTVHVLQGAERRVVIFSPVYGPGEVGQMMFDRSVNMLNVAVSRAMDSFLVFGNMNTFNAKDSHMPSGLLAKFLFAKEANRIQSDVAPTQA